MKEKIAKICNRSLEALWLVAVFFIPLLLFYPLNYDIFGLPRMVFFCVLVELMLVIWVAKIFIENKVTYKVNKAIIILIGLVVLSYLLNLFFSIHPLKTWLGSFFRHQGVYSFIHYYLFLLLLFLNFQNWPQIRRVILTILASSAFICFYGILQFFYLDFIDWANPVIKIGRIFSTLGQPNFFGHYLIIVIPLTAYSLVYFFKNFFDRFIILILLLAQIFCLIFTYSRSAWLGFFVEIFLLIFFIAIYYNKKIFKKENLTKFLLVILIFFSIFAALMSVDSFFSRRIKSITDLKSGSVKIRLLMWGAAIDEIKQMNLTRLAFGYGQENLGDIYVKYYQPDWGIYEAINSYSDRSHNTILDIILANGFSMLILLAAFYGYIFYLAIRYLIGHKHLKGEYWLVVCLLIILVGYFVNNLFSFSVISTNIYLSLILGLLIYLLSEDNVKKEIKLNFFTNLSKVLMTISLIILLAILIWFYNIKFLIADYYLMNTSQEIKRGDKSCQVIINNLNQSIIWNPFISYNLDKYIYYNINCLSNENSHEANKMIKENIEKVINLTSERELTFEAKINIARAYSLFGYFLDQDYYAKAAKMFKELNEISPNYTYIYRDWARIKQWQGDYDGAIEMLERGVDVIPNPDKAEYNKVIKQGVESELIVFFENLSINYFYKKDFNQALNYYDKILKLNPYQVDIYKKIANIYYIKKDLDRAIQGNERVMMLDDKNFQWSYSTALLYKEKGDLEKAKEYAEKALSLAPDNEEIKIFLAKIKK
ncbi:hypothetical protein COV49_03890 [Candidatus Falkowbacteria bacterium CG11_big_fil_rev_8_21_14_0_20_39_10]|uniref:O-antigen ligase-related domain-containing protein n=1 Tax=Candidatus Falkowbacteria bacterium CG11_big_fil_rev_8_21_14_0_20_39_10 TaxID=1974570 RepID=A0A2M6K865_9BACT|nr:MAG: hypothetical protein COV49_03890 [Candidatus Falkowbacteria bacterium CG11_big_fil_rev_8_21_14_0_20_39_10]